MGRRGENIHKRSDGRWEARVICGPPVNGRTSYKYLYSPTYLGVKALKKGFLLSQNELSKPVQENTAVLPLAGAGPGEGFSGTIPPGSVEPGLLFQTVAKEWLATKKLSVKESSYATYTFMLEKHLLPAFGELDIKDVDTDRIDLFLLDRKNHGGIRDGGPLSDKTISEIKGTLNRVLRYAKSHNMIETVPDSMPVSVKRRPIAVLTKQEQASLEKEALREDTPFSLGVLLCMNTGIRIGELCGLQWADFDWINETISIRRTVSRISVVDGESSPRTRVVVQSPKTVCSIRTVPIPSNIMPYIRERARAKSVYVAAGGEKFMEPRVCREQYERFERRAGVSHHNFHILRHTYATNCVEQGVNVKVLSENLGHSDVNITLQRYVHPSMDSKRAEVNKLTTFMNRSRK
ncbi:MAG: tyrosine-type recombinase/integrase [Clostridiales bacterium]|nr:tyrosine-type recombinase/integrase [Clostridiales bacterium]